MAGWPEISSNDEGYQPLYRRAEWLCPDFRLEWSIFFKKQSSYNNISLYYMLCHYLSFTHSFKEKNLIVTWDFLPLFNPDKSCWTLRWEKASTSSSFDSPCPEVSYNFSWLFLFQMYLISRDKKRKSLKNKSRVR